LCNAHLPRVARIAGFCRSPGKMRAMLFIKPLPLAIC